MPPSMERPWSTQYKEDYNKRTKKEYKRPPVPKRVCKSFRVFFFFFFFFFFVGFFFFLVKMIRSGTFAVCRCMAAPKDSEH